MRRLSITVVLAVIAAAALYQFVLADKTVLGSVRVPAPAATIDSGDGVVAVTGSGALVPWLPLPEGLELPALPSVAPPKGGRLAGSMLEQARVLGAAPEILRQYLARSYHGESGVNVEMTTGIELGFGDASQAKRKWDAVAAVLADSSVEAVDYVDVQAPARPAIRGSGHTLPPVP